MSEQEATLLKQVQQALIKGLVSIFLASALVLIGFYWSTTYRIAAIEVEMSKKLDKEPMQTEITYIKQSLQRIDGKLEQR